MYAAVMEKIGKPIVFNICVLGAVLALTNVLAPESIMKALKSRMPAEFLAMNQHALELGIQLGEDVGK